MSFDLDTLLGLFFFVVFIVLPTVTRSRSKQQRGRPGAPQRPPGQGAQGRTTPSAGGQGETPTTLGRTTTATTAPRGTPAAGQGRASTTSGAPSDSPLAMLEEIRRRVQEAQERERAAGRSGGAGGAGSATQASSSTSARPATTATSAAAQAAGQTPPRTSRAGRPLVASDPFERGLVGGAEQRPAPPASLGREGARRGDRSDTPRRASAPPQLARSRSVIEGADAPTARRSATARAAARRTDDGLGARLGALGLDRMDRSTILHGLIWHEILDEPAAYRRLRRQRSRPL